jgi:HK97 family phage prohead protease
MTLDIRDLPATEVRFATEEAGTFTGYASVWNEPDSYGDTIKRGAYAKTIKRMKPALLWAHDSRQPIGVWTDLVEDERGLKVSGKLVMETRQGAEAFALLKAGAVNGLSIGFRAVRAERGPNGGRVLTEIELPEISIVTMPAASKARVTSVRGVDTSTSAAIVEAVRSAAASIRNTR